MKKISGASIWIIGASSGIGKSLALQLSQQQNFVIASARDADALQALSLQSARKIKYFSADFGRNLNLDTCSKKLSELTDYLDLVIYCAGICEYEDHDQKNCDIYERALDVNFLGAVRTWKIALPFLQKSASLGTAKMNRQKPCFAVVSSLSTCVGFPRAEAYGSSKAALNYWMQSLRADYIHLPIDFSVIRPGFVSTQLTKNNDFAMPGLMTSEQASEIIIAGLAERNFWIDFPKKIAWPLKFFATFSWLWNHLAAPKITRLRSWSQLASDAASKN